MSRSSCESLPVGSLHPCPIQTLTLTLCTLPGLFEKHKLTACTNLLMLCLKKAGTIDLEELEYLMAGKVPPPACHLC